jgi:putative ABC transport system permease protein
MIPATYRANFSYLLRHPWQLALAILGIGIGVAVIVAVDLANASARKGFLMSMDAIGGEATHQVIGGPRGVAESVYSELRVENGIRNIAPIVEDSIVVGDLSMRLLGIDLFAESNMRTFTGEAASESLFRGFLADPGAVTMSSSTAESLGIRPGDPVTISARGRLKTAKLLGTFDDDSGSLDNLVVADIATAQAWLGQRGWLTRIDARIVETDDDALARFSNALPVGTRLLAAPGRSRATVEMSRAFMTNLAAMSLLALLVGLFLIFNTVSFSVLQRRELIGTLRSLGVTRRQVLGLVLAESAILGALAAVAGIALGVLLGEQLLGLVSRSINDLYFRSNVTEVSIETYSIVKGLVAGIGAALLGAAVPALEASSYQPRLALTRSALEDRTGRLLPYVTVAGVLMMSLSLLLLLLSGRNLVAGLAAVFLLILGFSLCVPNVVRAAATRLQSAAQRLGGTPARMAVAGIGASLSRTGVAIVALAVAVSATIGVSVMVDSFRGSVSSWLQQTLQADVYAGPERGSMDSELAVDLRHLAGIEAVSSSRRAWIEEASGRTQLIAIRMAPGAYAGTQILDADPAVVWPAWESGDVVLVSEPYAYQKSVRPGDVVSLPTDSGTNNFTVAASFQSYDINSSAVLMSRSTYDRHYDDPSIDSLGFYLSDTEDVDDFIAKVESTAAGRQAVRVNSNARIRDLSLEIFDRTFVITDVLYWLAVGVAFIGIVGAMLALQLERAREFALLRALGMTPLQVGRLVTTQTAVIGLLSGLAAVPLGIVMAFVLIKVINRRAFGWQIDMATAPDILFSAVLFAVIASLLAGLYPAYRASRSEPAVAMREE